MWNIGFIGVGGMGFYQAQIFAKLRSVRIVAGADPSPKALSKFMDSYPGAEAYDDHRKLLRNTRVDAVVVAVPTLFHKPMAIAALRSGRPVLTEKPAARTVADVHRMIDVANKSRKLLMVAHCRRFDPNWGAIAQFYRSGKLGRPVLWRSIRTSRGLDGWFLDDHMGGGPLIDGAVHDYDFCNNLFGRPEKVLASAIKLDRKFTALDTANALVRYASGDQMMLSWSWSVHGPFLMDVLGPKGSLIPGAGQLKVPKSATHHAHGFCFTDLQRRQKLISRGHAMGQMYINQAKHFLACLDGKVRCQSPATEAIKAVAIAEAIRKVAVKGGTCKVKW